jgi:predicted enzyme related to lactoylglutathione lyase
VAGDPRATGIDGVFLRSSDPEALYRWHFGSSGQPFMANFQVHDLDGLLARLGAAGVHIDPRREDFPYGRFAWIVDPDGNRVELWEPPAPG